MVERALQKIIPKFEIFLIVFILFQPIIDLATSLSIHILEAQLTIGIISRFAVMLLTIAYLLLIPKSRSKSIVISYLIVFFSCTFISLINNILVKNPVSLFSEVKHIAKIAYLPVMLFGYFFVIQRLKERIGIKQVIQKYIFTSMIIVSIVMILASITNTGIDSYESIKLGHQGWFYAGNEIGAIMAISFGIVVYFAFQKTVSWKQAYYWLPVMMLIFSQLAIGTKVGYGSVFIVLFFSLAIFSIERIKYQSDSLLKKKYSVNISITSLILLLFLIMTPYTPIYFNMNVHLSWVGLGDSLFGQEDIEKENTDTHNKKTEEELKEEHDSVQNLILSGREQFLKQHKMYYAEAPISQKLFGMGFGGNYKEEGKTVEMDFYDIFFSLGILGFLLYITPLAYLAFNVLKRLLINIKFNINSETVLYGSSIILGLGIAYTAGHVLTAPAVSIYLAVIVSYLYHLVEEKV